MIDQEFMSGDPRSLCTFLFLVPVSSISYGPNAQGRQSPHFSVATPLEVRTQ